ncbi:MAG TPA: sigma-70 family RNA polymerase sigma factor [Candidatus Dormibacteraeota bacterium]
MTISDEGVLDLLARHAPEGIEVLYDRYGRLAYSLALRILGDEGAAEDVVQESFLAIWRRSATYRPERGSLRTWACSIVHHRAVDRLRGRSGRARQDLPLQAAPAESNLSDTWEAVAAELERDDIRTALDRLPAEQRQTIELAYFGGYTQSEIAALMKVPLGTVKGRTRIALGKLRDALAGHRTAGWSPS